MKTTKAAKTTNAKSSPKKKPVKKAVTIKKATRASAAKASKKAAKPTTAKKKAVAKKATKKPVVKRAVRKRPVTKKTVASRKRRSAVRVGSAEMARLRDALLTMRQRLTQQVAALKSESLHREDRVNIEEDGTDAFDRQFALELASSESESLFEIDEALRRIEDGSYGQCEECDGRVEKPRLKALPFVRRCIACQSKSEQGGRRHLNGRVAAEL